MRDEVDLHRLGAKIDVKQDWIAVGDLVTGVYLNPNTRVQALRDTLLNIPMVDNIIGDLNYTQRYQRRALLEVMRDKGMMEKPAKKNTWRR